MFPVLTTDSMLQTLGLGTLSDAISCEVEEERNGVYELTLTYPQGGVHASDIALNALIVAKPNFTDDPQPFRVYSITKEIGTIEVHAQHISYDLGGVVVSPTTMTGATCKQAGDYLLTGTPFTFKTDKTNSANFKVDVPSSARSWLGGKSGSLLDIYGTGEYHFDGYDIVFNLQRGTNRGVQLRYGKNLTELKSEADCTNLASSVVCYYEEDGTVTSGNAVPTGITGITRELAVDVSEEYDSAPSVATLTSRASQYIADHNLTVPKTNITLDFVQASKLKDRVDLCDTVSIYYEALDVSATMKCIRTVWDVLAERYTETEFGDAKTNITDTILAVEKTATEAVTKTTMQQAIDKATDSITHGGGEFRIIYNGTTPIEIVSLDDPDITQALSVWRWNNGGFGHSSTGYNGQYTLALLPDGSINAEMITTGILNANIIRAGILQDAQGLNSWNLQTGALTITNGSIHITTNTETESVIQLQYESQQGANYLSSTSPYRYYVEQKPNGSGSNFFYSEAYGGFIRARYVDPSLNKISSVEIDAQSGVEVETVGVGKTKLSYDSLKFYNGSGGVTAIYPSNGLNMLVGHKSVDSNPYVGRVINLGVVSASEMGISSSASASVVAGAWLAFCVEKYPNAKQCVFEGVALANSYRMMRVMIYDTSDKSGIQPNVASGTMQFYNGDIVVFGANNYNVWTRNVTMSAQVYA